MKGRLRGEALEASAGCCIGAFGPSVYVFLGSWIVMGGCEVASFGFLTGYRLL